MEGPISELPNEMLCLVLDFLDNKDKLHVMSVCKKWKEQLDENVGFYNVILTDETYQFVRKTFGHRRVKSIRIYNYSRTENPFTNLDSLRVLNINESVSDTLLAILLRNAVNLQKVSVAAHAGCLSPTELLLQCGNHQRISPAACSAKRLEVDYRERYESFRNPRRFGPWNTALDYAMPNVEELYFKSIVHYHHPGLDIFWLLASKPQLRTLEIILRKVDMPSSRELQPLVVTKELHSALTQVRLTSLTCNFLNEHIGAWEIIFSSQTHLRDLKIHDINGVGFEISIILPLLKKCKDTLSSIDLKIDAMLNSKIDLQIFSHLKFLESLKLEVCNTRMISSKELPNRVNVPTVENISKIFTTPLVYLRLTGFEFSEEDVINAIIIASKRNLNMISVDNDLLSIWKSFKCSLPKMGFENCVNTETYGLYSSIANGKHYIRKGFVWQVLDVKPKEIRFNSKH